MNIIQDGATALALMMISLVTLGMVRTARDTRRTLEDPRTCYPYIMRVDREQLVGGYWLTICNAVALVVAMASILLR